VTNALGHLSDALRAVCLHEAGHAVVARSYGYRVVEIRVQASGNGHTAWEGSSVRAHGAAVTAAGEEAQHLFDRSYVDLSCGDLRTFEREHGGFGTLWRARREARERLTQHRAAVIALASRLAYERRIQL
jgi:hypothetical protein